MKTQIEKSDREECTSSVLCAGIGAVIACHMLYIQGMGQENRTQHILSIVRGLPASTTCNLGGADVPYDTLTTALLL